GAVVDGLNGLMREDRCAGQYQTAQEQRPPPDHGVDSILCRMSAFELDAYLARVGWQGSLEPTFDTLAGLTRAHITRIPFENVDVLLGRGIRIDLDSIAAKMVAAGRGGYCF